MQSKLYSVLYCKYKEDQVEITTVEWVIYDFLWLLNNQTNREITTNTGNDQESICIFPVKMKFVGKENDFVEIYYKTPVPNFLKSNLAIRLNNFRENNSSVAKDYQWVQANKWQLLLAQSRKELLCGYHADKLTCSFKFWANKIDSDIINNEEELSSTPKPQLNTDLEKLLLNPQFSDITIKSMEGDELPAHKLLLNARSTVFKAHFEHDTVEKLTNVVEAPLETEVLKEVLSYIYTDKVPKLDEMAEKMLIAADFYQLSGLKGLCEEALHKNLSVENAIETLELAILYTAINLQRLTLEFIHDGNARDVIKTEAWRTLQSAELFKIIYEYNIINNNS